MKVLIGYSDCDATRLAFEALGHDVWTCDLRPSGSHHPKHIQRDILEVVEWEWDFALLHPMCTYLTISAAWAFKDPDYTRYPEHGYHQKVKAGTLTGEARRNARDEAIGNFERLLALPYTVAIENPAPSFLSTMVGPAHQILQPYDHGDDASKSTGIWTNNEDLPKLPVTNPVAPRWVTSKTGKQLPRWANQTDSGQNRLPPSDDRWLARSKATPSLMRTLGTWYGYWLKHGSTAKLDAALMERA